MATNKTLNLIDGGDFTGVVGSELVTNGNFSTAGAGGTEIFSGWTNTAATANLEVQDVDEGQFHGGTSGTTHACNIWTDDGSGVSIIQSGILTTGKTYLCTFDVIFGAGFLQLRNSSGSVTYESYSSSGKKSIVFTADDSGISFVRGTVAATDATIDNVSVKELNAPITPEDEWDISGGDAAFTGQGLDSTLSFPTIGLVEGNVYDVYIAVSNVALADGTAYIGIQLGGGTAYELRVNKTWDENDPLKLVCGSSVTSGLEITTIDNTAGDTATVDTISVVVTQFKPSTNLDSVQVSGNLRVPATGTNEVPNGDFAGGSTEWFEGVGWSIADGIATATNASSQLANTGASITVGKEYLVKLDPTFTGGSMAIHLGGTTVSNGSVIGEAIIKAVSTTDFYIEGTNFTGTIDNVEIYELTEGPIDEYESNGTYNNKTKYTSSLTHANGAGGTETWDLWWDGSTDWIISPAAGTKGTNYWNLTQSSPVGSYTANGSATGQSTVSYGPTDHSIATGSPGLETDGTSGYIDLKTSYDYLNDLRTGKFAIVSVFSIPKGNDASDQIYNFGPDADNVPGLRVTTDTSHTFTILGTSPINITCDEPTNSTVSYIAVLNGTAAWGKFSSGNLVNDASYSGLNAFNVSLLRLGAKAFNADRPCSAKFAFHAIIDLTDVTTVDATFATGLSTAINNAAISNRYDATAIANAINTYIVGQQQQEFKTATMLQNDQVFGVNWASQSFTASSSFSVDQISIWGYRSGLPGTVTVSLRAADENGLPTGADLASGTFDGDAIGTVSEEKSIVTLSSSVPLTSGQKYCVVVKATAGDVSNHYILAGDADVYAGLAGFSGDSGGTWGATIATDFWFRLNETGDTLAGVYWPLNEATKGDAGSYYLLAKRFESNSEYTSEFYGLVSPDGVTGAVMEGEASIRLVSTKGKIWDHTNKVLSDSPTYTDTMIPLSDLGYIESMPFVLPEGLPAGDYYMLYYLLPPETSTDDYDRVYLVSWNDKSKEMTYLMDIMPRS